MQSEVAALGWIVPQGVFSRLGKRRRFFGCNRLFSCGFMGAARYERLEVSESMDYHNQSCPRIKTTVGSRLKSTPKVSLFTERDCF